MKNLNFKRAALFLLCALLAITLVSCNDEADNPGETTPDTVESSSFVPDNSYVIVRSDTDSSAVDAAVFLRDAINEAYGLEIKITTDFVKRGDELIPAEHEILVGTTNRASSIAALESLRSMDYLYSVESANVIVITGGSGESTLEAARKFASDIFGYGGETFPGELSAGASYTFEYDYPVKNLRINNIAYSEYAIAYENTGIYEAAAETIKLAYEAISGVTVPVLGKRDSAHEPTIRISALNENDYSSFEYQIYTYGGDILIRAASGAVDSAVARYLELYCDAEASGDYNVEVPDEVYIGYSFESETNGLELVNRTDTPVCAGVTYSELEYVDKDGKPVIAYMITAAPGSVKPLCGTPYAAEVLSGERQQVIEQALAAEEAYGLDICAAVNGDLYYIETDNSPCGMNFKNGVKLSEGDPDTDYFAVLKDGSFYVGENGKLDESLIDQAIGGRYLIMKEGKITDLGNGIDFSYIRHPRTTVGYKEDGTLMLIVVDGRQPSFSNGASLADLALIYQSFGAYGAVNIDGGGSSICITKNYESGEFGYWNSPSDGSPRRAMNSLLLARNEDYEG